MKPKTIILMVVAVVAGLAASYMTSKVIAERNNDQGSEEEKVTILVAQKKIAFGTLIKDPQKFFVEKPYTKGEEPKKAGEGPQLSKDKKGVEQAEDKPSDKKTGAEGQKVNSRGASGNGVVTSRAE